MAILKPALAYFLIVFGAGFVLGVFRTLVLVPRLGDRMAELLEMPVMLAVVFFAARFTVKKWGRTRRIALAFGPLVTAGVVYVMTQQLNPMAFLLFK